jgi:hypothetical protein
MFNTPENIRGLRCFSKRSFKPSYFMNMWSDSSPGVDEAVLLRGQKLQRSSTAEEWSFSAIFSGRGRVLGLRLVFLAVAVCRAIGLSGCRAQA